MSQNYSEDVASSHDGQPDWSNLSTGMTSPIFPTSPSFDNAFAHSWVGEEVVTSPIASPVLSTYGTSAPASLPTFDLDNSFEADHLHDYESLSHSVPNDHRSYNSRVSGSLSFHRIEEQPEYESFSVEMIYNQEDPGFITKSFAPAIPSGEMAHMPPSWRRSYEMARTNSAVTSNSAESFNSGQLYDDRYDDEEEEAHSAPQKYSPLVVRQKPVTRRRAWSNTSGSAIGSIRSGRTSNTLPVPTGKGRKGKLTAEQRADAAIIRRIGACKTCRTRRAKCDMNIPCTACRRYYRNNPEGLVENPCRGEELNTITNQILAVNAFPKGSYERFLGDGFRVEPVEHRISLDLGFGSASFPCHVKIVRANSQQAYAHNHLEYPWQPIPGEPMSNIRRDLVFPAILSDRSDTSDIVEEYLAKILNNRDDFQYFPLWRSDLKILRHIYKYYLSLSSRTRSPLKQALQLLVLLHAGGDIRIIQDDLVESLIQKYLPNCYGERVIPCFIRAQLGPIFSNIALKLMREVLKELEQLSPVQDVKVYPMVICTFAVLFMTMESLQYHFDKIGFHCHHDSPTQLQDPPRTRDNTVFQRSDILLRFYQSTTCHSELGFLGEPEAYRRYHQSIPSTSPNRQSSRRGYGTSSTETDMHRAIVFMDSLYCALHEARHYLQEKVQTNPTDAGSDLSSFFDCLLAKMFMKGPTQAST